MQLVRVSASDVLLRGGEKSESIGMSLSSRRDSSADKSNVLLSEGQVHSAGLNVMIVPT